MTLGWGGVGERVPPLCNYFNEKVKDTERTEILGSSSLLN